MKFIAKVETDKVRSEASIEFEIDDDEFEGMTEIEKDIRISEVATQKLQEAGKLNLYYREIQ